MIYVELEFELRPDQFNHFHIFIDSYFVVVRIVKILELIEEFGTLVLKSFEEIHQASYLAKV